MFFFSWMTKLTKKDPKLYTLNLFYFTKLHVTQSLGGPLNQPSGCFALWPTQKKKKNISYKEKKK